MKEVEEMRRDKQQKLEEIETELSQTNSERFKNLMKKLERSSSKKKELDMQKSQRLFKMNTLLSEKQHSILERKDQGSNMVYSNLLGIENRLTQTSERKKRFIEEKINRSQKYLSFVDEKQKKANEVKASLQQSLVQKVVNKLVKVRSKSAMLPLKHADNDEYNKSNFQMDHRKRLELFNQKKLEEENLRLNKYKEKETRMRNKSGQRREELSKFTQEKRMEWKQKLNYIQNNKKISSQEANKKFDDMLVSYRNKIENILSTKIKRRERLEKLDRNFALGLLDKSSILTAPNMLYHTSK